MDLDVSVGGLTIRGRSSSGENHVELPDHCQDCGGFIYATKWIGRDKKVRCGVCDHKQKKGRRR